MRTVLLIATVVLVACGGDGEREWGEFYDDGNGGLNQAPCPTDEDAELAGDGTCSGLSADAEAMIGPTAATYQCGDTATGAVLVEGVAGCCVSRGETGQTVRFWYECEAE